MLPSYYNSWKNIMNGIMGVGVTQWYYYSKSGHYIVVLLPTFTPLNQYNINRYTIINTRIIVI